MHPKRMSDTNPGDRIRRFGARRTVPWLICVLALLVHSSSNSQERGAYDKSPSKDTSSEVSQPGYLGIVIHTRSGLAFVKKLVPGWPGEQSGLKPGDQLMSVDGIPAQAPELKSALDRLSGASGTPVELRVLRRGESAPLIIRALRTSSPPPALPAPPSQEPQNRGREALGMALEQVARGDTGALTVLLEKAFRERPFDYPTLAKEAVQQLILLEGDFAFNIARAESKACAMRFPTSAECADSVRLAYAGEDRSGALATFSKQIHKELAARRSQFQRYELDAAIARWQNLELLGQVQKGNSPLALFRLRSNIQNSNSEIQAESLQGDGLWRIAITPDGLWESVLGALQSRPTWTGTEAILERILNIAEPAWIWPHFFGLDSSAQAELKARYLEPRWSLGTKNITKRTFFDVKGLPISPEREFQGRPALLLYCLKSLQSCEQWRLPVAAALADQPELSVFPVMILRSPSAVLDSALSWPVWYQGKTDEVMPNIQVVGADGTVLESYHGWEQGLEYRILWQLQLLNNQEVAAESFAATGGTQLNGWEMRWIQSAMGKGIASWNRPVHTSKRLWISGSGGRMDLMEEGQIRTMIDGLGVVDGLWVGELDGDSREELLVYHAKDHMLEALDTAGATRWIRMEDAAIEELVLYDGNADGIDELLLRRRNDPKLYSLRADGNLAWSAIVANPILSVATGQQADGRPVLAVLQPGVLTLLDQGGMKIRDLTVDANVVRVELIDLDGNGESDVITSTSSAKDLVGVDVDGDGKRELAVIAPGNQVLLFRNNGKLLSRMSWADDVHALDHADMDGDGREELTLHGTTIRAILEWHASKSM